MPAQGVRGPQNQQADQQGNEHIAVAEIGLLAAEQGKGHLGYDGEQGQTQRIAGPVGGVAEAVDDEKDKDGEGQSADAAKGKIQRVGAAKAVADMIQKHEKAGEDPQRKRRHESTSGKVLPKL